MNLLGLFVIVVCCLPELVCVLGLLLATSIYIAYLLPSLSWEYHLASYLVVLAIPIASYFLAVYLGRYSARSLANSIPLGQFALLLSLLIAFSSNIFPEFGFSLLSLLNETSSSNLLQVVSGTINAIILVSALSAAILIFAGLVIELPVYWFSKASRGLDLKILNAFRILFIVLMLSLSLEFIAELFGAKLWPRVLNF